MTRSTLIDVLWLIFWIYWIVSAFGVKKNTKRIKRRFPFGILAIVVVILFLEKGNVLNLHGNILGMSVVTGVVGVALCLAGMAFAVWARVHIGRNWSGIPSIKEGHELVTSGPYRFVRHPIYTGILLALVGSVFAGEAVWLVILIIFTTVLISRIGVEERLMREQFPDQYPRYQERTNALIPFVW